MNPGERKEEEAETVVVGDGSEAKWQVSVGRGSQELDQMAHRNLVRSKIHRPGESLPPNAGHLPV